MTTEELKYLYDYLDKEGRIISEDEAENLILEFRKEKHKFTEGIFKFHKYSHFGVDYSYNFDDTEIDFYFFRKILAKFSINLFSLYHIVRKNSTGQNKYIKSREERKDDIILKEDENIDYVLDKIYVCTKNRYNELINTIILKKLKNNSHTISELIRHLKIMIPNYLSENGLLSTTPSQKVLFDLLKRNYNLFIIDAGSYNLFVSNDISNYIVRIKSKIDCLYQEITFYSKIIQTFREFPITLENPRTLLDLLSLETIDFGFPKPYNIDIVLTTLADSGIVLNENKFFIPVLTERIKFAAKRKITLSEAENLSGFNAVLLFYFTGSKFPVKEAKEYVDLRSLVFINFALKNIEFKKLFKQSCNIIEENLKPFLGDTDFNEWCNENLLVSFVIDTHDEIKKNIDSAIKEFSPVLNLERNPGNLFKDIIEKKKLEYYGNTEAEA